MAINEERLCEKVARLFNLGDFLYSFFFGLLPSLVDIATDFCFAARLRWKLERSYWQLCCLGWPKKETWQLRGWLMQWSRCPLLTWSSSRFWRKQEQKSRRLLDPSLLHSVIPNSNCIFVSLSLPVCLSLSLSVFISSSIKHSWCQMSDVEYYWN